MSSVVRTIRIQIGKKYWDLETCRKSQKKFILVVWTENEPKLYTRDITQIIYFILVQYDRNYALDLICQEKDRDPSLDKKNKEVI